MAKAFYLPKREADLVIWSANFTAKLVVHGPVLGATPAELASNATDNTAIQGLIASKRRAQDDAADWADFVRLELHGPESPTTPTMPGAAVPVAFSPVLPGILIRIARFVKRLKGSPSYTEAIGQDLGIEGAEITPDASPKPTGSVEAVGPGEVRVKWKKGQFTGVVVECQRAGETAWTVLGQDNFSPYLDARPLLVVGQPEERRYRLRYLDGDELVGEYSGVMAVTVS